MEGSKLDREPTVELPRKSIFACFENRNDISPKSRQKIDEIKKAGMNIEWNPASVEELEDVPIVRGGERTWVISPINEKDKYSEGYFICLGIIAVGRDREGKNISLLAHLEPDRTFIDEE